MLNPAKPQGPEQLGPHRLPQDSDGREQHTEHLALAISASNAREAENKSLILKKKIVGDSQVSSKQKHSEKSGKAGCKSHLGHCSRRHLEQLVNLPEPLFPACHMGVQRPKLTGPSSCWAMGTSPILIAQLPQRRDQGRLLNRCPPARIQHTNGWVRGLCLFLQCFLCPRLGTINICGFHDDSILS